MPSMACSPCTSAVAAASSFVKDKPFTSFPSTSSSAAFSSSLVLRRESSSEGCYSRVRRSMVKKELYGASIAKKKLQAVAAVANPNAQKSAEADVMGLLLRQRIVFLGYNMDDFVADAIVSQLLLLDAQDPTKDIRLFINSPGGSISAAMAIFDAIQLCRAHVSTIAFGIAASTASIVLAGGSKGKRLAMPNTRIMMHQPLGGASGQAIDVEIQAKEIMYHKKNITHIISEITGCPYEQVEKDIDRDRYMSPIEAMEYGFIDGVIDKDSIIPLVPLPGKVKSRLDYKDAGENPRKFLIPVIPDDEII